jgi:deoxyribodipyrimidine photo-lyase
MTKTGLFIFRRDFRFEDNLSLVELSKTCTTIYPIFIFTPTQTTKNTYFSSNSFQFLVESLKTLPTVSLFFGDNVDVITHLIDTLEIDVVAQNRDYTPYAKQRDAQIRKVCEKKGVEYISLDDYTLVPYDSVRNGSYYSVFNPFYAQIQKRTIVPTQTVRRRSFKSVPTTKYSTTFAKIEKLYTYNDNVLVKGGRKNALAILRKLKNFKNYANIRNLPKHNTTLLSAYIKYGCVSIREVYRAMVKSVGKGSELVRQLVWHDFYAMLMDGLDPKQTTQGKGNFQNKTVKWVSNASHFLKWCEGKTGFPIVDAAMRQLNIQGWMPNRCRLIVSNFLAHKLRIDWRKGEKYFAQMLIDYDVSSNNLNWQFTAGVGTDRTPYARIYNPFRQSKEYDKDCEYIYRWIPELDGVEPKAIHTWDTAYDEYDTKYPRPIV